MTAKVDSKDDIQPKRKKKKCALDLFTTNKWRTPQTWKNWGLVKNWIQSMGFTDRLEVKVDPGLRRLLDGAWYCTQKLSLSFTEPQWNCSKTKDFFQKLTPVTRIFKYWLRKNIQSCSLSTPIVGCTNYVFRSGPKLHRQSSSKSWTLLCDIDFAVAYLDDILMKSQNVEQYKEHVHKVFSRIQGYGFKLKESKCDFFIEKNKYLGHIIDKDCRTSDSERSTQLSKRSLPNKVS